MVIHAQQLYGRRRVICPGPGEARLGDVPYLRPGDWEHGYASPARVPGDSEQDVIILNEDTDSEGSSGEVPWLSTVEHRLLQQRGRRSFQRRYGRTRRRSRRFHPYDFEAILDNYLLSD